MFGSLGEMAGLMKKFGEMQSNMKKMQAELAQIEVKGTSHSNLVEVEMSGDMIVRKVTIASAALSPDNKDILEASVQEAIASALQQVKMEGAKRLADVTGGIKLPGFPG